MLFVYISTVLFLLSSIAAGIEDSNNASEDSIVHSGILQHSNGLCVAGYIPEMFEYELTNGLTRENPALIRLVENCKEADDWSISKKGILKNSIHNLVVYSVYGQFIQKALPGTPILLYNDHKKDRFIYEEDGQLRHHETKFCLKIASVDTLPTIPFPELLVSNRALVLSNLCDELNKETFEFKERSSFLENEKPRRGKGKRKILEENKPKEAEKVQMKNSEKVKPARDEDLDTNEGYEKDFKVRNIKKDQKGEDNLKLKKLGDEL